jgi:hypothetical protein
MQVLQREETDGAMVKDLHSTHRQVTVRLEFTGSVDAFIEELRTKSEGMVEPYISIEDCDVYHEYGDSIGHDPGKVCVVGWVELSDKEKAAIRKAQEDARKSNAEFERRYRATLQQRKEQDFKKDIVSAKNILKKDPDLYDVVVNNGNVPFKKLHAAQKLSILINRHKKTDFVERIKPTTATEK